MKAVTDKGGSVVGRSHLDDGTEVVTVFDITNRKTYKLAVSKKLQDTGSASLAQTLQGLKSTYTTEIAPEAVTSNYTPPAETEIKTPAKPDPKSAQPAAQAKASEIDPAKTSTIALTKATQTVASVTATYANMTPEQAGQEISKLLKSDPNAEVTPEIKILFDKVRSQPFIDNKDDLPRQIVAKEANAIFESIIDPKIDGKSTSFPLNSIGLHALLSDPDNIGGYLMYHGPFPQGSEPEKIMTSTTVAGAYYYYLWGRAGILYPSGSEVEKMLLNSPKCNEMYQNHLNWKIANANKYEGQTLIYTPELAYKAIKWATPELAYAMFHQKAYPKGSYQEKEILASKDPRVLDMYRQVAQWEKLNSVQNVPSVNASYANMAPEEAAVEIKRLIQNNPNLKLDDNNRKLFEIVKRNKQAAEQLAHNVNDQIFQEGSLGLEAVFLNPEATAAYSLQVGPFQSGSRAEKIATSTAQAAVKYVYYERVAPYPESSDVKRMIDQDPSAKTQYDSLVAEKTFYKNMNPALAYAIYRNDRLNNNGIIRDLTPALAEGLHTQKAADKIFKYEPGSWQEQEATSTPQSSFDYCYYVLKGTPYKSGSPAELVILNSGDTALINKYKALK